MNDDRHVIAKALLRLPHARGTGGGPEHGVPHERALKAVSDWIDEQREKGSSDHAESENVDVPAEARAKRELGRLAL